MPDQTTNRTGPRQAETANPEPSLRSSLETVLPLWTHWGGSLFGPTTATWTTTAGTWSLTIGGFGGWPRLTGPGGTWVFGSRDAGHIIGVLRALAALSGGPAPVPGSSRRAQEPAATCK